MPAWTGGEEALQAPLFLLASVRWPDSLLLVTHEDKHDTGGVKYHVSVERADGAFGGLLPDPTVKQVGFYFTKVPVDSPDDEVPLMISSAQYANRYLYIPQMELTVETYKNDPGAGGYWFFEPPRARSPCGFSQPSPWPSRPSPSRHER